LSHSRRSIPRRCFAGCKYAVQFGRIEFRPKCSGGHFDVSPRLAMLNHSSAR
jgi:hypothetical protein